MLAAFAAAFVAVFVFAVTGYAQTESLLIGPGDMVQVDVIDTPDLQQQVRVSDSGNVSLAYLGEVKIAGLTPAAAGELIEKGLVEKSVMLHPHVVVRIQEYATQDVSVVGQVRTPGTYTITTAVPVLKIISLAGGLTDMADRHITIKRHQGSPAVVPYYLANNADEAISDSVLVYPGDIVVVQRAPIAYILGDVARPGGFAMTTNDSHLTLLQAMAMAGSANKTAVTSKVRLIRKTPEGTNETQVNLKQIEKGKDPDLVLQANDVLYVPFSWAKNVAMSTASIAASTSGAAIYVAR